MTGKERREKLLSILEKTKKDAAPISATALASQTGVSRQVIVGDIALLRTAGYLIGATPRGYLLGGEEDPGRGKYYIVCNHTGAQMEEELSTVVDFGGVVENVIVDHPLYGKLTGELKIACRYDVTLFCDKVKKADAVPLSALTEGVHTHLVTFSDGKAFEKLCEALKNKGILLSFS